MHRKKHMWKMRLVAAGLVAILGISCFQSGLLLSGSLSHIH